MQECAIRRATRLPPILTADGDVAQSCRLSRNPEGLNEQTFSDRKAHKAPPARLEREAVGEDARVIVVEMAQEPHPCRLALVRSRREFEHGAEKIGHLCGMIVGTHLPAP